MKSPGAPLLSRLLDPLGDILTPEVARKLAAFRFDRRVRARIDSLARRCNNAGLSDGERREYEAYVDATDLMAILQAKARAVLKRPADA